tara:strand:- start:27 stop:920 length:894 start_codon:yes stop_codon:yes gene_type:complete
MDRQIILLLEQHKSISDSQLMTAYFLSYKNYHNQSYLLKEIFKRAMDSNSILDILSNRGKNILMTMIRNISNYSHWKKSSSFQSLIEISLQIISVMSEQQLNYQFNNYSRIITYQQDILESVLHNRETPSLSTINIDDNNLQDKIKVGDTSLIYALRLWPATSEIIWSLLQKNINIKPKSYQVWSYQSDQVNNIICKTIEEIPNVQIPIQIVWKNWKYFRIPQPRELDIYYKLLLKSGKENIPKGIVRDGMLPQPCTHLGKVYHQSQLRYLVQQILIRQTCLPEVFIDSIFRHYLER